MTDLEFSSDITVKLVRHMAADEFVVQAAQVSAKGETSVEELIEKYEAGKIDLLRFINALMKGRHGSPFEHNAFTFFVEAPLFVFREWQRHRIGSFNEMSGRYTVLPGKFYIPGEDRIMFNSGTKMKPVFLEEGGGTEQEQAISEVTYLFQQGAIGAWVSYETMLNMGIANEVARMVLPLNIYSQMYWTVNARSLMNFLSLRGTQDDRPEELRSYPQREIQMGAEIIEMLFDETMPHTYHAFVQNGRVAP